MHIAAAALIAALLVPVPTRAETGRPSLTLEETLSLARERAPAIALASARIDEARGRLVSASVWLRENPRIETAAGERFSDAGNSLDAEVGVIQAFELGGQRGARIAGAEADLSRASAARDDATRRLLREVATSFWRAIHARDRLRLAREGEDLADEVVRIAERRHRADEVPILDVNLSRAALARARSDRRSLEAARATALGELRVLLGMSAGERLAIRGELRERPVFELSELLDRAADRADLRALEAEIRDAEADLRLARGAAWPELELGAVYARDEGDDIARGALAFTLPVFEQGRGRRAEASARARRLRLELEAERRAVDAVLRAEFEAHARLAEAVAELEQVALPLLDENESLARRSYEAGQIGLIDLLTVRRETLLTRVDHLDRLLQAALAAVELRASAGVLQ